MLQKLYKAECDNSCVLLLLFPPPYEWICHCVCVKSQISTTKIVGNLHYSQRHYFATAKDLMQLNGTTKSLVANHLAESIAGSMTIRAFEEEDRFFVKNLDLIDVNATPFFHSFAANEWLIQQLETLTAVVLSSSVHGFAPFGNFQL